MSPARITPDKLQFNPLVFGNQTALARSCYYLVRSSRIPGLRLQVHQYMVLQQLKQAGAAAILQTGAMVEGKYLVERDQALLYAYDHGLSASIGV